MAGASPSPENVDFQLNRPFLTLSVLEKTEPGIHGSMTRRNWEEIGPLLPANG